MTSDVIISKDRHDLREAKVALKELRRRFNEREQRCVTYENAIQDLKQKNSDLRYQLTLSHERVTLLTAIVVSVDGRRGKPSRDDIIRECGCKESWDGSPLRGHPDYRPQ